MSAASKTWNITCKGTQQSEIPMGDKTSQRKHDTSADIQVSDIKSGHATSVNVWETGNVFHGSHTSDNDSLQVFENSYFEVQQKKTMSAPHKTWSTADKDDQKFEISKGDKTSQRKHDYFASITFKAPNESVFNALRTELEEMKRFSKVDFCLVNTVDTDLKVTIDISKRHTSVESCCASIKILVEFRRLKELIEKNDVHCVYSIPAIQQLREDEESDISRKADKLSAIAVSDQHQFDRQSEKKQFKVHGQILISASDSGKGKEVFQLCKERESDIRLLFEDAGLILKSIDEGCTKISFKGQESDDWTKVLLQVAKLSRDLDKMISPITTSTDSRINVEASPNVTINYTNNSTNHYGDNVLSGIDEQRSAMQPDSSFKEQVDLHSNITLKTPDESVGSKILAELFEMKEISKIPFELVNNVAVHKEVKVIIMNKFRSSQKCCESIDLLIEYHHLKKLIDKNGVHRVYWMSTIPPLKGQNGLPIIKKGVGCQSTVSKQGHKQDVLLQSNIVFNAQSERAASLLCCLKKMSSMDFDLDNAADLSEVKVVMKEKHTSSTECCKSIDKIIVYLTLYLPLNRVGRVDRVDRVNWISTTGALNEENMKPFLEKKGSQSLNCRTNNEEKGLMGIHYGPSTIEDRRITIGGDCRNVSSGNDNSGPMNAYVTQEQGQRIG